MSDQTNESQSQQQCRRVGLVYDERMCKHATPDPAPHPENPERIPAIWNKLVSAGIPQRFTLSLTHTHTYIFSTSILTLFCCKFNVTTMLFSDVRFLKLKKWKTNI